MCQPALYTNGLCKLFITCVNHLLDIYGGVTNSIMGATILNQKQEYFTHHLVSYNYHILFPGHVLLLALLKYFDHTNILLTSHYQDSGWVLCDNINKKQHCLHLLVNIQIFDNGIPNLLSVVKTQNLCQGKVDKHHILIAILIINERAFLFNRSSINSHCGLLYIIDKSLL